MTDTTAIETLLKEETGGKISFCTDQGDHFRFGLENVPRTGLAVFKSDEDYHYIGLGTEHNDDAGRYSEVIFNHRPPCDGQPGLVFEYRYWRDLIREQDEEDMEAEVEGRIWITTPADHQSKLQDAQGWFYRQAADGIATEIGYIGDMLRSLAYFGQGIDPAHKNEAFPEILAQLVNMNRAALKEHDNG